MDNEFQPPVDGVAEAGPVVPKTCMLAVLEVVCNGFVISYKFFLPFQTVHHALSRTRIWLQRY